MLTSTPKKYGMKIKLATKLIVHPMAMLNSAS